MGVPSLTNASVVRKFLFAVSLSGNPGPFCQRHRLVNNLLSIIYFKQWWNSTKKNINCCGTKINYILFDLKIPMKLSPHIVHCFQTIAYLSTTRLYESNFTFETLWIMVTFLLHVLYPKSVEALNYLMDYSIIFTWSHLGHSEASFIPYYE